MYGIYNVIDVNEYPDIEGSLKFEYKD